MLFLQGAGIALLYGSRKEVCVMDRADMAAEEAAYERATGPLFRKEALIVTDTSPDAIHPNFPGQKQAADLASSTPHDALSADMGNEPVPEAFNEDVRWWNVESDASPDDDWGQSFTITCPGPECVTSHPAPLAGLDALCAEASATPWEAHGEMVLGEGDAKGYRTKPLLGTGLPADARLAALMVNFGPRLARALEKVTRPHDPDGTIRLSPDPYAEGRAVLAELEEALDGIQ